MKFEVFNKDKNNLKVAFLNKNLFGTTLLEEENIKAIAEHNKLEIHIFDTSNDEFVNFKSIKAHKKLNRNKRVIDIYDHILQYIKNNKINVCIFFGSGYPWHESFLNELRRLSYTACYFGDDPEGCKITSKYYVKNFHYAFCGGIYFDENTKISDKYLKWGARKSKFVPLGVCPTKYREVSTYEDRDIDLVYVGGCYFPKVFRMFKLKKHFGNRMQIYGRGWNNTGVFWKDIILKIIKIVYQMPQIEELPKDELVKLYQNTKVGFNMHMSYGPSNMRMYELPANGVMQLCDCEKGLVELYEIDREIIAYSTINDAIKKIEYYIRNDQERENIAIAGHKKVMRKYKLEYSFEALIREITNDIDVNFSDKYKK